MKKKDIPKKLENRIIAFEALARKYIFRDGLESMLKWLREETDFYTSPCSTKYHLNCEGGLYIHSLNVFDALCTLISRFTEDRDELNAGLYQSVAICALFHDVCKINSYRLLPDGTYVYVENNFPYGHGEKSVVYISQHIKLTDEEMLAIRWHMGSYDLAAKSNDLEMNQSRKKSRLVTALHLADMIATHLLED